MKKSFFWNAVVATVISAGLFFSGCNRTEITDDQDMAQRNSMAEGYFEDVNSISSQAAEGDISSYKTGGTDAIASGCATVTKDSSGSVRLITIDFGPTNCLCRDGKNRRGKILVSHTGRYTEPGTVINITFEDYYVDDNHVQGSKTIENLGPNAAGHLVYHILVEGSITLIENGETITWTADKYREWISGVNTPKIWNDDTFYMWGTRTGVNKRGQNYTAVVRENTPLFKKADCRHFVSGSITFTQTDNQRTSTMDFGDGRCDNLATLTINGRTKTITLRH